MFKYKSKESKVLQILRFLWKPSLSCFLSFFFFLPHFFSDWPCWALKPIMVPLEIFPNSFRCFLLGTVPSDTRELLLVHWERRWGELQHLANTGGLSVLSTNSDLASKEWGQNQQNFYFDFLSCFRYLWLHSKLSRLSVKKKKTIVLYCNCF